MSSKTPAADRSKGGPGSSHADATKPDESVAGAHHQHQPRPHEPAVDAATNPDRSTHSGGGGERDRHHRHDAERS